MSLIDIVRDNFPGIGTEESLKEYRNTVIKNMKRKTALCVKSNDRIVGILIFSYNAKCLSCMAVHPQFRKQGIGSALVEKMISLFPVVIDISVSTFREDDPKGIAPRALYKKYGFEEGKLITEFNYPHQKFILKSRT